MFWYSHLVKNFTQFVVNHMVKCFGVVNEVEVDSSDGILSPPLALFIVSLPKAHMCLPGGSDGKASAYNVEDLGSTPGLGRSAGEGNDNPLQYY